MKKYSLLLLSFMALSVSAMENNEPTAPTSTFENTPTLEYLTLSPENSALVNEVFDIFVLAKSLAARVINDSTVTPEEQETSPSNIAESLHKKFRAL